MGPFGLYDTKFTLKNDKEIAKTLYTVLVLIEKKIKHWKNAQNIYLSIAISYNLLADKAQKNHISNQNFGKTINIYITWLMYTALIIQVATFWQLEAYQDVPQLSESFQKKQQTTHC